MALKAILRLPVALCMVTLITGLPQRRQSNVPFLDDLSVIDCRRPVLAYFPDPDDCRNFYHCSEWTGLQKKSCGNLYFNPETGVCDWPSIVRILRPECPSKDVVQPPIINVPQAFQALTTEERDTLKIIQLKTNNNDQVRFSEPPGNPRKPVGSVQLLPFPPPQKASNVQQNSFDRPIAAVLNNQSPPLKISALPPPPPPPSQAQPQPIHLVPQQLPNPQQIRQPTPLETPHQQQQFQPLQPIQQPQVQPPQFPPLSTVRVVGSSQPVPNQQFVPLAEAQTPRPNNQVLTHSINPHQQRQPVAVIDPQLPAPPRTVVVLSPTPPPVRFENPESGQPLAPTPQVPPTEEEILIVDVTTAITEVIEPTQSSVVLNKSPEEKNRSQHPNQKRRPIHNRVKVENQIAPEPVQEEEKHSSRSRVPIHSNRPAPASDANLPKINRNRFELPSQRPNILKQRRPIERQPDKIKEVNEEEEVKTLPKADLRSRNRARLQVPQPVAQAETLPEDAFLLCSDDSCFEPNGLEDGEVLDLKPAASARLPDDNLKQIFEQMTVRLSSDSKDKQQADTIRLFLEVAKEGGNNQEDKLEENEKLEEDVEVMTQKDDSQDFQESSKASGAKLFKPASDRPRLVLPKKSLLSNDESLDGQSEMTTSASELEEVFTTIDQSTTPMDFTFEQDFTTEETRANREIISNGFSLNSEQQVHQDDKENREGDEEVTVASTLVTVEKNQDVTGLPSESFIVENDETTTVDHEAIETTPEAIAVIKDLTIIEPVAVVLPEFMASTESTNVNEEQGATETAETTLDPEVLETTQAQGIAMSAAEDVTQTIEFKDLVTDEITTDPHADEESMTTVQPDSRPSSLSTLGTLLSKLNSGDPVDTFLSIMSNFDLSALVSVANKEDNKDQVEEVNEDGVQVVLPVGWFETPDEDPVVLEDEITQAPLTVKPEQPEKINVKVTRILEEEVSPTTTLPQLSTATIFEDTITAGQVDSTTLGQLLVDEATTLSDLVEVVTPQDVLVVTGVSENEDLTTKQLNQETTLRSFDEKSRKQLSRLYQSKTRIPVVPASASKSATETEEQERSKFANSRNRIRQRLRTLSATTSATKALEILNNKANLENGQKVEAHSSEDEKLSPSDQELSDENVPHTHSKINVTKLVGRRNELFKKRVPINTSSQQPREDASLTQQTLTTQRPLFANPSRQPFRSSLSSSPLSPLDANQPASELTAGESSTTTLELTAQQNSIRCKLFRRVCKD